MTKQPPERQIVFFCDKDATPEEIEEIIKFAETVQAEVDEVFDPNEYQITNN